MPTDYLEHHGIKGQKWYVRRFQPYSVTGKLKSGKTGKEIGAAAKKQKKEPSKKKSTEPTEEDKQRLFEEGKQKALKSGSAADVLKYQGHLTNQEMTEAINRIRNENSLKSLKEDDRQKRINDLISKAELGKKTLNTVIESYNTMQKAKSMLSGDAKKKEQRTRDINQLSAEALITKYGYGKLSTSELDAAIKRLKKEHELENIAKGIYEKGDKKKDKGDD